jgi:ferritin
MFDQVIFKKKKFSDILEEIYKDTKTKEKQVNQLIAELKPLIQDTGDATLVVPLIKEYLEIGVKNSDNLIKMAAICQRVISKTVEASDGALISEDEKEALLSAIQDIEEEQQKVLPAPKIIDMPKG